LAELCFYFALISSRSMDKLSLFVACIDRDKRVTEIICKEVLSVMGVVIQHPLSQWL